MELEWMVGLFHGLLRHPGRIAAVGAGAALGAYFDEYHSIWWAIFGGIWGAVTAWVLEVIYRRALAMAGIVLKFEQFVAANRGAVFVVLVAVGVALLVYSVHREEVNSRFGGYSFDPLLAGLGAGALAWAAWLFRKDS